MKIFVFFSSVVEKVTEDLVVVDLELEDIQALFDDWEMLWTLLATIKAGYVFPIFIDEMRFEDGCDTMVVRHDDFALVNHLLEEEEQHAFTHGSGPGYFGAVGLAGEEFVEIVRKCVFGNPADLNEFLAEHIEMSDSDTTPGESDICAILLLGFGLLRCVNFWSSCSLPFAEISIHACKETLLEFIHLLRRTPVYAK